MLHSVMVWEWPDDSGYWSVYMQTVVQQKQIEMTKHYKGTYVYEAFSKISLSMILLNSRDWAEKQPWLQFINL